jgi:hypothetical protein
MFQLCFHLNRTHDSVGKALGTGHNLAGGVGRWKQWGGHIFFSQEKGGGFIKY